MNQEIAGFAAFENEIEQLHRSFSPRLPRYTSYPTAAEFTEAFDREELEVHFRSVLAPQQSVSLYVHIPFCAELCYFCACNKIISKNPSDKVRYLELLTQECNLHQTHSLDIRQLHFGGGSPSYLETEQIVTLVELLGQLGKLEHTEKSIEIDCRTLDSKKLQSLLHLGFSRVSLGVQDFDEDVQRVINRNQSEQCVRDCVEEFRASGNVSINFDLIYGLPGQTLETFTRTIEKTIELSPDRVALYGYAAVQWKVKVQKAMARHESPSATERVRFFHRAITLFQDAGYRYIGLDHFAKPEDELSRALDAGKLRRNFMGYTTQSGDLLLGLGSSAISDTGQFVAQKYVKMKDYESSIVAGRLPFERIIQRTEEDRIRAYCIEALMCRRMLSRDELLQDFPESVSNAIFDDGASRLQRLISSELAAVTRDRIDISNHGAVFLRFIASVFDAYLEQKSGNVFSAAL